MKSFNEWTDTDDPEEICIRRIAAEKKDTRMVMGKQIASSISEDIKLIVGVASNPEASQSCKFLLNVVKEMLKRLQAQGVPLNIENWPK
jgi:hypothetical protein